MSHADLAALESGSLPEIEFGKVIELLGIIGLRLEAMPATGIENALSMAARTASTSYKNILSADILLDILISGLVPVEYRPHLMVLLDETPLPIVLKAIHQASGNVGTEKIMRHMANWAVEFQSHRKVWL